ncbi:cysteine protease family C01A [Thraustotheca clavata]|uniref:Cysteine protease family C01A n=1 Tax=Thraustotheca clavata TaxID=74557 RepID=A0A1V9ZX39_9STRA|nr:cysteine protease family C01A [Thraustotheca clavata]
MQRTILIAAIAAAASADISPEERTDLLAELESWEQQFGNIAKQHGFLPTEFHGLSGEEATNLKLQRLKDNKAKLPELQKQNPDAIFTIMNPFGLMNEEEFNDYVQSSFQAGKSTQDEHIEESASLEAAGSVDWTTSKCMPAVKNQGQCGSCWAFSATGAAAMGNCIAGGGLYNLAEQQVVDCEHDGQQGCNGGWEAKALDWIHQQGGLCLESNYPYTSGQTKKAGNCQKSCKNQKLPYVGKSVAIKGESALTTAIKKQPVTVAVEAGNNVWQHYQSGIVSSCPGKQSDHAVIAVGYGSASGKNFYKIRNSWGASWGEKGYIRLQRGVGGKGMCNVAEMPAYPQLTGKSRTAINEDEALDIPPTNSTSL